MGSAWSPKTKSGFSVHRIREGRQVHIRGRKDSDRCGVLYFFKRDRQLCQAAASRTEETEDDGNGNHVPQNLWNDINRFHHSQKAHKKFDNCFSLCAFMTDEVMKGFRRQKRFCLPHLDNRIGKCIQDVWNMWSHYADTPGATCFLFINAIYNRKCKRWNTETAYWSKVWSDQCLAKCTAVVWGGDTYF